MEIKTKRLLKDLTNLDDDLRALSAMTLMKLDFPEKETRTEVLSSLIEATRDKNVSVRFFARRAIDKIKKAEKLLRASDGETGTFNIDELLQSEDFEDRLQAVMIVKKQNLVDYKQKLVKMLSSEEHAFVRAALVSTLSEFLEKEEAGVLSPFLNDYDNRVRSNTIEALEKLKSEEAIPGLFSALADPDNRIRSVAAKALQSFGEEKVFAELKKMLDSSEEWMKGSAIYALSHIQAGEAIELLVEAARNATHSETRIKAIVALANYHDLTSFGFLRGMATGGEGIFKETAQRSLKLLEEKFGVEPPVRTLVTTEVEEKAGDVASADGVSGDNSAEDIASAVSKFFRMGKDEEVGLSHKASLSFSVTDIQKEIDELFKEVGRSVFEMYQAGEVEIPELLTLGHEVLRMNFFIQKYSDQEEKAAEKKTEGFFGQLKSFFGKSPEEKKSASQADKFVKKRDELFLRFGKLALKKFASEEFQAKSLEPYSLTYQKLQKKIDSQKQ